MTASPLPDDATVVLPTQPAAAEAPGRARPRELGVGEIVGAFRIAGPIGRGGAGSVYDAVNVHDGTRAALKIVRPEIADRERFAAALREEARALAGIRHPAVVQYRTSGPAGAEGEFFLATDFVEGPTLGAWRRGATPAEHEIAGLAARLARGLAAAHAAGVIHRDLSPDNVILRGGRLSEATLIDFGIAKGKGFDPFGDVFAGKLSYAAPEQFSAEGEIGPWTDVYGLGLLLAAVARGSRLDMGRTFEQALERRRGAPDLAGVPPEIARRLAPMLEADIAKRTRTMAEVAAAFAPLAAPPEARRARSRRRLAFGSAAAAIVAAFGFVGWHLLGEAETPPAPARVSAEPPLPVARAGALAGAPAAAPADARLHPDVAAAAARGRAEAAQGEASRARALEVEREATAAADAARAQAALAEIAAREACADPDAAGALCGAFGASGDRYAGRAARGPDGRARPEGPGVLTKPDGRRVAGEFSAGLHAGVGVMTGPDGARYEGGFVDGVSDGPGVLTGAGGDAPLSSAGIWTKGALQGPAVLRWADGSVWAGDVVDGIGQGHGVRDIPNRWRRAMAVEEGRAVVGVQTWPNGNRYEGEFARTDLNGLGVLYGPDGEAIGQGVWTDGALTKPME